MCLCEQNLIKTHAGVRYKHALGAFIVVSQQVLTENLQCTNSVSSFGFNFPTVCNVFPDATVLDF